MPDAATHHSSAAWRDAENYVYAEKLTPEEWAWEFLRRGSKYRAASLARTAPDEISPTMGRRRYQVPFSAASREAAVRRLPSFREARCRCTRRRGVLAPRNTGRNITDQSGTSR